MTSLIISVAASGDDGYGVNSTFDATGAHIKGGSEDISGSKDDFAFMRFLNVTIPRGAIINSAVLRVIASERGGAGSPTLTKVKGNNVDNASAPTTYAGLTGLAKTTAAVDWDIATFTDGVEYDSPDLSSIITEIIARAGWASGNAMTILIDNDGGSDRRMVFHSYDETTYTEPKLVINYTVPFYPQIIFC